MRSIAEAEGVSEQELAALSGSGRERDAQRHPGAGETGNMAESAIPCQGRGGRDRRGGTVSGRALGAFFDG